MNWFSLDAVLFGVWVVVFVTLPMAVLAMLARFYRVRVKEFGVLGHTSRTWSLHERTLQGIRIRLGWFPTTSSMQVTGITADCPPEELPYALVSKPKWVQWLFHLMGQLLLTTAFLLGILFLDGEVGYWERLLDTVALIGYWVSDAFAGADARTEFLALWAAFSSGQHPVLLAFLCWCVPNFLMLPFQVLLGLSVGRKGDIPKAFHPLGNVLYLGAFVGMVFLAWRLYVLLLSSVGWEQTAVWTLNGLLGLAVGAVCCYVTALVVVRMWGPQGAEAGLVD